MSRAPYTYESTATDRQAMDSSFKVFSGHEGIVRRSDGEVVWRSPIYRSKSAAVLQANRQLPRFRAYLERNGECWFDRRTASKKAIANWKEARKALFIGLHNAASKGVNARVAGQPCDPPADLTVFERNVWEVSWGAAGDLPPEPKLFGG